MITEHEADELIEKHFKLLEDGLKLASYPYFVVDQIAEIASLEYTGSDTSDDASEDDSTTDWDEEEDSYMDDDYYQE